MRWLEESYPADFALQEIEGKFVAQGGSAFFAMDVLETLLKGCMTPLRTLEGGVLKVWREPAKGGKYVAGGDLSWGESGAYSVLTVLDARTGEQVAALRGRLPPDEMARLTVRLCKEYHNAFLGVEVNGEGVVVVRKLVELGYGHHLFYRAATRSDIKQAGWLTDAVSRPFMLGELAQAIRTGMVTPRCAEAVQEMLSFVRDDRGRPSRTPNTYDDHVISWTIAWQMRNYASSGESGPVWRDKQW